MPSASGSPAGPIDRSRSAVSSSAPASRQAMSSQTWATIGGRGFEWNDPEGHVWYFAEHVREMTPEDMKAAMKSA